MYILSEGVELPENDLEFSYVEISGGLDALFDNFVEQALKKNTKERTELAMGLSCWLLAHWKTLYSKGMLQIYHDPCLTSHRSRYRFGLGFNSTTALDVYLPPHEDESDEVKRLSKEFEYIIDYCGVSDI